jgi:hypothetical protein
MSVPQVTSNAVSLLNIAYQKKINTLHKVIVMLPSGYQLALVFQGPKWGLCAVGDNVTWPRITLQKTQSFLLQSCPGMPRHKGPGQDLNINQCSICKVTKYTCIIHRVPSSTLYLEVLSDNSLTGTFSLQCISDLETVRI